MVGGYSAPLLSFRWNNGVCSLQKAHKFHVSVWVKTRGHLENVFPIHLFSPGCASLLFLYVPSASARPTARRAGSPKVSHKHSCQHWHTTLISAQESWFTVRLKAQSVSETLDYSSFYPSILYFFLAVKTLLFNYWEHLSST